MLSFSEYTNENFEPKNRRKPKHTKFIVTACAFDSITGKALADPRDEEIDITTNELFQHCENLLDVHEAYESFWNRMRGGSKIPAELVFVQKITPVK